MKPATPDERGRAAAIRRSRAWRTAAAAVLWIAMVGGCGPPAPDRRPGLLQVDIETSPGSIDPRFTTDAVSSRLTELIYDSLVKLDAHGRFVGDLAETIERPSPTRMIFHLRPGIRFSDGRRLTARDVKYTYDSVRDPATLSPKRAGLRPLLSIAAPDDLTVVMTTAEPYAPALEMGMLGIVADGSPPPGRAGAVPAPGSGPFRLVHFSRDEMALLERNPLRKYPEGTVQRVRFKVVPDPTVRALELAEGICGLAENNIEPHVLPYLRARRTLRVVRSPGTAYQYLSFNFRVPALRDLRVRRAFAFAIDRQAIVDSYLQGTARVASGMLSPENWAYQGDVMTYRYDPARARRLLDEAGYPADPDGRRHLELTYKTTPEGIRLAQAFQAMLGRVGITISVRTNEWATYYRDIQHGNFELTSLQWVGINEPHHYYMVFDSKMTPPYGLNRGGYSNPEMDRLVEAGARELDPARRRAIYSEVQRLAARDLPYVSLWWRDNVVVMNRRLRGFRPYPNGSLASLATIRLLKDGPMGSAE